jgi:hypothetical protein
VDLLVKFVLGAFVSLLAVYSFNVVTVVVLSQYLVVASLSSTAKFTAQLFGGLILPDTGL